MGSREGVFFYNVWYQGDVIAIAQQIHWCSGLRTRIGVLAVA